MNSVVEQFQQFRMDGNIVPHSWYQAPRLAQKSGKPNLVAITLLADILYWYRPAEIHDEALVTSLRLAVETVKALDEYCWQHRQRKQDVVQAALDMYFAAENDGVQSQG